MLSRICVYMCMCVQVSMCVQASIGARRGCHHLELKSQVVASHSLKMQGMELWSSARTANIFLNF